MKLPAGFVLTEEAGGRRIVRRRRTGLRFVGLLFLVITTVGLGATALWSAGEGDVYAGICCVAAPFLLGPLAYFTFTNLVKRHQLVLHADGLTHEWHSYVDSTGSARIVRLGIIHSPETTDGPELYFLAVAYSGTDLRTLPGWSDSPRELQALGQWIHDETGVPFQPEPVPPTGLLAG